MSTHDWFIEHRTAFATGALDGTERESFAEHVTRCAECREAVDVIEQELRWLPMGLRAVAVRPGLRASIARALVDPPVITPKRGIRMPLALAATFFIAVAGVYDAAGARSDLTRVRADAQARVAEVARLRDTISVMRQASRVLQAAISVDGRNGGLLIFADNSSHRWNVVMHGLPAAPTGQAYQFWFITVDGMVRSVTLSADPARPAFATLEMPPTGAAVMGASLTLESSDARSPEPRGRELAHLML